MGTACGCDRNKNYPIADPFDINGKATTRSNAAKSPPPTNMDKAPLLPPSSSISVSTTVTYSTTDNVTVHTPSSIDGFGGMDAKTMQLLMKVDGDTISPTNLKSAPTSATSTATATNPTSKPNTDGTGTGTFPFNTVSTTTTIQSGGAPIAQTSLTATSDNMDNMRIPTDDDTVITTDGDVIKTQPPVKRITTDEKDIAPENERLATITNVKTLQELANNIKASYDIDSIMSDKEDHTNDESSGDDHSELDEEDVKEIERLKSENHSNKSNKGSKTKAKRKDTLKSPKIAMGSKVYRQGTATAWEVDDMEDMHREMSQQLQTLAKQTSDVEIQRLQQSNQLSDDIFVPSKLGGVGTGGNDDDDQDDGAIGLNDLGAMGDDEDVLGDELQLPNSNLYRDGSKDNWNSSTIERQKQEMKKQMMHLAQQSMQIQEIQEIQEAIQEEQEETHAQ